MTENETSLAHDAFLRAVGMGSGYGNLDDAVKGQLALAFSNMQLAEAMRASAVVEVTEQKTREPSSYVVLVLKDGRVDWIVQCERLGDAQRNAANWGDKNPNEGTVIIVAVMDELTT